MTRLTHDRGSLRNDDRLDVTALAIQWFQEQAAADQKVRKADRLREMIAATVADEDGWALLNPTRQALGMTIEQARRAEAMSGGKSASWI